MSYATNFKSQLPIFIPIVIGMSYAAIANFSGAKLKKKTKLQKYFS